MEEIVDGVNEMLLPNGDSGTFRFLDGVVVLNENALPT